MLRSRQLSRIIRQQCLQTRITNSGRPCINVLSHNYVREQGTVAVENGYIKKFMKAVGWMDQSRTRLKLTGYFLYESIPTKVKYTDWFEELQLPDTFASWFNITELHVWMLMVRYMAEDITPATNTEKSKYIKGDGHFVRNCIIEAMWADVANKIKLLEIQDDTADLLGISQPIVSRTCKKVATILSRMSNRFIKMAVTLEEQEESIRKFRAISNFPTVIGAIDCTHIRIKKVSTDGGQLYINRKGFSSINVQGANPAIARKQVSELSEQFQAALVAYDEGLNDDRILAAAIWRRFYMLSEDTKPENVERVVKLIRHQVSILDKIPGQDLRWNPEIPWLSILEK